MIKVHIIESERGWGQKIDEVMEFPTQEEAEAFARKYNSEHNPPGPTPDWYMYARVEGQGFGMLRKDSAAEARELLDRLEARKRGE